MVLRGMVVAGIAGWVAAPLVGMARRGTVDQQTVAAWRTEPVRLPRASAIPAPRTSVESTRLSA